MLFAGVKHLTDFQDPAYAGEYLDRVAKLYQIDLRERRRGESLCVDRSGSEIRRHGDDLRRRDPRRRSQNPA